MDALSKNQIGTIQHKLEENLKADCLTHLKPTERQTNEKKTAESVIKYHRIQTDRNMIQRQVRDVGLIIMTFTRHISGNQETEDDFNTWWQLYTPRKLNIRDIQKL